MGHEFRPIAFYGPAVLNGVHIIPNLSVLLLYHFEVVNVCCNLFFNSLSAGNSKFGIVILPKAYYVTLCKTL